MLQTRRTRLVTRLGVARRLVSASEVRGDGVIHHIGIRVVDCRRVSQTKMPYFPGEAIRLVQVVTRLYTNLIRFKILSVSKTFTKLK